MSLKIGNSEINDNSPTYFIADIGANHDGSLKRAKKLIEMCINLTNIEYNESEKRKIWIRLFILETTFN